jgi:small-conductance mechanosensitive channel
VLKVLRRAADGVFGRLDTPEPRVLLTNFGASGVTFEVSIWCRSPWLAAVFQSQLNEAIWRNLRRDGISIPYAQLDVHLDRASLPVATGPARPGAAIG